MKKQEIKPSAKTANKEIAPKSTKRKTKLQKGESIPLVPVRDAVHFPKLLTPLLIGRDKSIRALDEAIQSNNKLFIVAQREAGVEEPETGDLYSVGVISEPVQVLSVPDGTMRVVLKGLTRARLVKITGTSPYFSAIVEPIEDTDKVNPEIEGIMRECFELFDYVTQTGKTIPPEATHAVQFIDQPGLFTDQVTHHLTVKVASKQLILETFDTKERLEKLIGLLRHEREVLDIQMQIHSRVEKEMGNTQREYYLREQMRIIQHELGDRDDKLSEISEYQNKINDALMPAEITERAKKELDRLEKMPPASPEGTVIRTYLDWLTSLPWSKATEDTVNVKTALKILDEDHYGLKKVKDRILEFLAVSQLSGTLRGPILCFVGPPGVGKTSIGRSIARALGRKFIRVSLGGVRDEAEIRGHRRTYIGAMPGRIIHGIRQAGTKNPIFMLDEIDKLGMDFRGDPTAALLEALDPEQNDKFSDHYLEVAFDLSDVMFIATANLLDTIPPALRDRMEIIQFPGYTEDEKLNIAKQFLIQKKITEHGLNNKTFKISDAATTKIIREYTREAGVRNLERELATVCRKVARKVAEKEIKSEKVDAEQITKYLGHQRYHYGVIEEKDEIAAATGLVYTEYGGDVVTVEVSLVPGKCELILTGQLGDVMQESAKAALTFIRSRAEILHFDSEFHQKNAIHIHVPAGAVPKDGPSAGITLATALASALTNKPIRKDVAMTGEITLRGKVLPVGGVKEKVLAAHRAGIKTVIMPFENERDLEEIAPTIKNEVEFKFVRHMDEVLGIALAAIKGKPKKSK